MEAIRAEILRKRKEVEERKEGPKYQRRGEVELANQPDAVSPIEVVTILKV